jgi:hypothetical protein
MGLQENIKSQMVTLEKYDEDVTTFDEIAEEAAKTEKNLRRINHYKKSERTGGEERKLDDSNHQQRGNSRRGGYKNHNKGSYNKSLNNREGNNRPRKDKSEVECYKCKQKGHYANECTQKDTKFTINNSGPSNYSRDNSRKDNDLSHIKCYNCNGMGHYADTCRKPKKDKRDGKVRKIMDELKEEAELSESEDEMEVDHGDKLKILQEPYEQQSRSGKEE